MVKNANIFDLHGTIIQRKTVPNTSFWLSELLLRSAPTFGTTQRTALQTQFDYHTAHDRTQRSYVQVQVQQYITWHTSGSRSSRYSRTCAGQSCTCARSPGPKGHQGSGPSAGSRWTATPGEANTNAGVCRKLKPWKGIDCYTRERSITNLGNGERRTPLVLQDVKADAAIAVYVWMEHLGAKCYLHIA